MLNLKIVMKVLKAQGKNYLAEPDVIVHNKETFRLPSMFPLISYVFPCTEILKVYGCLTAHLLKYLQA